MQILGFHIIDDAELKRRIEEARKEQRQIESSMIKTLLHISESYRKKAEVKK